MAGGAYADSLQVAVRQTGEFRPGLASSENTVQDGEEVGVFASGSFTWDEGELRDEVELVVRRVEVKRTTTVHQYTSAGADYASLQVLVEAVADGTAGLMLAGLVAAVRKQWQRHQVENQEVRAANYTDADFEFTAVSAVARRYTVRRADLRIDSVERRVDGRGAVELSLPEEDGRRFQVEVEMYGDGLRAYRMKRVNAS